MQKNYKVCKEAKQSRHRSYGLYEKYFKRPMDLICAIMVIILFWWLYVLIAVLVRINLGPPVIFTQERPGKINPNTGKEEIFKLYKFRSMADTRDKNGNMLPDEKRLTRFGKVLRSTSMDELPEVFNIMKGNMSVVGPRPLLVQYLPRYSAEQRRRHEVRPGLTGYAQVHGRNTISWEEKFQCDIEYVDHITFLGDVKIILYTIFAVLGRVGVHSETAETMEEFKSDKKSNI